MPAALNSRSIIVYDFETGSRNPEKTQPTQLAALALDGFTLKVKPNGFFNSEIRPIFDDAKAVEAGLDPLEDEALKVTRKTREGLATAPELKLVWGNFVNWAAQFNVGKSNSSFTAPIPAGYNINGFDSKIITRLARQFGNVDGNGVQKIFNPIYKYDLMDIIFSWMENLPEVRSISMDNMRIYFGFPESSKENAHDALQDVKDTANILIKFINYQRRLAPKTKFEKAFANGEFYI